MWWPRAKGTLRTEYSCVGRLAYGVLLLIIRIIAAARVHGAVPQAVLFADSLLPQHHFATAGGTGVDLAIGTVPDTADGLTLVGIEAVQQGVRHIVVLVQPTVPGDTDKGLLLRVQGCSRHLEVHPSLAENLKVPDIHEDDAAAIGNGHYLVVGVEFQGLGMVRQDNRMCLHPAHAVPHPYGAIIGRSKQREIVPAENGIPHAPRVTFQSQQGLPIPIKVEESDNGIYSQTSRHHARGLIVQIHTGHCLGKRKLHQLIARDCAPDASRSISTAAGHDGGLVIQGHAPHSGLVASQGANPVASVAMSQYYQFVESRRG